MIVADLPIGAQLYIGISPARNKDQLVWTKVSEENDFILSEMIGYGVFDAQESSLGSRIRSRNGNNFYPHSNIHQWLNAFHGPYNKSHEYDILSYNMKDDGFLSYFLPHELDALVERQITVVPSPGNTKSFGKTLQMTVKVTLPALSEFSQYDNSGAPIAAEGRYLPALTRALSVIMPRYQEIMTRTGIRNTGTIATYRIDGTITGGLPALELPFFPMIRLRSDAKLSDDATQIEPPEHFQPYDIYSEILSDIITASR